MTLELNPTTEEELILTLFDLVSHMTRNGEELAGSQGLTVQQWLVLLQIAGDPNFPPLGPGPSTGTGILASEIASARGVSRASTSAQVTALLRKRMIRQVEDPDDRRRRALVATRKGLEALRRIEPQRQRANAQLFDGFSEAELDRTLRVLRRCLVTLWEDGQGVTAPRQRAGRR